MQAILKSILISLSLLNSLSVKSKPLENPKIYCELVSSEQVKHSSVVRIDTTLSKSLDLISR